MKDWARYASVTGRFIEILDRIGRQTGEIMRLNPQIIDQSVHFTTVLNAPEWLGVQKTVLTALLPFPEARAAVVAALRGLEGPPAIEGRAVA